MEGRCSGNQGWQGASGKKSTKTSEGKHYRAADKVEKRSARTAATKESPSKIIEGYGAMTVELSTSN